MTAVSLTVADGVGHIELTRPEASNSFDLPTARELNAAIGAVERDESVGVVLLTGAGPRFCAGGDVASFVSQGDRSAHLKELADVLDGALQRLSVLPKPVVAGVQGAVAGAGIGVMLSADLIVAERATKFVTAYVGIGLNPDCGVSWLLPRAVGQPRALELLLNGRVLDGDEALDWGLVTQVVDEDAAGTALELARRLAQGPVGALGQSRRLARESWAVDRATSGADEAATIAHRVTTPEAEALIGAFLRR